VVAASGLDQKAELLGSVGARAGHISSKARSAQHIIHANHGDEEAAVAHVVLRHEVTTTEARLKRALTSSLSKRLSVVVVSVRRITKATADSGRVRVVSVDKVFANHQVASRFLALGAEAQGGKPAASSTVEVVDDFEGFGV